MPLSPLGTNLSMSLLRSRRAVEFPTVPTSLQLLPPFSEYCQVPLPLVSDVIAMPSTAPASLSVMRSPPAVEIRDATVVPELLVSSSVIVARVMMPVESSTGASFTGLTAISLVTVVDCNAPSLTVNETVLFAAFGDSLLLL